MIAGCLPAGRFRRLRRPSPCCCEHRACGRRARFCPAGPGFCGSRNRSTGGNGSGMHWTRLPVSRVLPAVKSAPTLPYVSKRISRGWASEFEVDPLNRRIGCWPGGRETMIGRKLIIVLVKRTPRLPPHAIQSLGVPPAAGVCALPRFPACRMFGPPGTVRP